MPPSLPARRRSTRTGLDGARTSGTMKKGDASSRDG
jgi:hypothetical protein